MIRQFHRNKDRHMRPQLLESDPGVIALDQTRLFQTLQTLPTGAGRETDARRQIGLGDAALIGQHPQDIEIARIQLHAGITVPTSRPLRRSMT